MSSSTICRLCEVDKTKRVSFLCTKQSASSVKLQATRLSEQTVSNRPNLVNDISVLW